MRRNTIHDILPPERPRRRRAHHRAAEDTTMGARETQGDAPERGAEEAPGAPDGRHLGARLYHEVPHLKGRWVKRALIAGGVLAALFLLLSFAFTSATVTVYPKQASVRIDGTFSAYENPPAGALGYRLMTVEKIREKTVPATGESEVKTKASGTIVIYNEYDDEPQRLIATTRFETPDGKIYRIPEAVVVPGKGDGGSVEVRVVADEAGEEYNIGLTDFTIPGFKGTDRYEGFYARSKTPMTGGFDGIQRSVGEKEEASIRNELRTALETAIREDARTEAPEGYYLFEPLAEVSFQSLSNEVEGADSVRIREQATLSVPIFAREDFARFVAANTIAGYDGRPVEVLFSDTLTVEPAEGNESGGNDSVAFSVSGDARIVWLYDSDSLRDDLRGRAREALPTVLSGYPGIERAKVSVWPFWKRSFPEDAKDITVRRNIEDGGE